MADSAGVQLATGPAIDRPIGWTLTEQFRLGGADSGAGSFSAAQPFNSGTDAAGRIYVLDAQQFRVEVFTPAGAPLRFLGRQGGGPGELQFPLTLFVAANGAVHVFDVAKRSLVRWDSTGQLLDPISVQGVATSFFRVSGDTLVFARQRTAGEELETTLVRVVGSDTLAITRHAAPAGREVQFSCVSMTLPPVFTPGLQWTAGGDLAAVTHQTPYRIDVYRGGTLTRSIRRPVPPKPAVLEDVSRLYPEGMRIGFGGGAGCTIPASEVLEKQGVAPSVPVLRSLVLDRQGRIWAERYTFADESGRLDLFDAEGRYLGTLEGTGPPLGFIGEDVVLFSEENADTGIRQIVAYRIGSP